MAITFDVFSRNYRQLKVNQKPVEYLLEDTLPIISEFNFVKEHHIFYPQGIFTDEKLALFFFTNKNFSRVTIGEKEIGVETWDYDMISSINLIIKDRYHFSLTLNLKDGESIVLDNKKDTNEHHSNNFKETITSIHKLLTEKND
jgi:hypothetical protein